MKELRRPGAPWRLLVHEWDGKRRMYGHSHGVQSGRNEYRDSHPSPHYTHHELPPAEFDELVVGRWCHIEQMDSTVWWMNIGGVTLHVTADRDGRPKRVTIDGPGDYAEAEPGCDYELRWSGFRAIATPVAARGVTEEGDEG